MDSKADHFFDWSPYVYALDNPIRLIDPDGNAPGDPQDPTKQKITTNPSSKVIQTAIAQGNAASNIRREATGMILNSYYGDNLKNVSQSQWSDMSSRVSNRISVSFSGDGIASVNFDGSFPDKNKDKVMNDVKDHAKGLGKDIIEKKGEDFLENKVSTKAFSFIKGASTTVGVISNVMDPVELGNDSAEPSKDAAAAIAIVKGLSNEKLRNAIIGFINQEANSLKKKTDEKK